MLVEGLPYPTALLISPDGNVYISIHGAYSAPGTGAILRFKSLAERKRLQIGRRLYRVENPGHIHPCQPVSTATRPVRFNVAVPPAVF